jgi:hypothetical protein
MKYLWKLERLRGPLDHPEVLVQGGRPVTMIAQSAPQGARPTPPQEVLEWAAQHPGWTPVHA